MSSTSFEAERDKTPYFVALSSCSHRIEQYTPLRPTSSEHLGFLQSIRMEILPS